VRKRTKTLIALTLTVGLIGFVTWYRRAHFSGMSIAHAAKTQELKGDACGDHDDHKGENHAEDADSKRSCATAKACPDGHGEEDEKHKGHADGDHDDHKGENHTDDADSKSSCATAKACPDSHGEKGEKHKGHTDGDHDDHKGESHTDDADLKRSCATAKASPDGHGEEDDNHQGHADEEAKEPVVRLTPEQAREFGIKVAKAGPGVIERRIKLPGEILINSDRAAHIVPRAEGIVREVLMRIGDRVKAGQAMAVVESAELSGAQSQYLAKLNKIICCTIDLTRAEALQESLKKLLSLLDKKPTLDDLLKAQFADIGEGHSKLVAAYAELVFTQTAYERENILVQDKASSLADFQVAKSAYKKAHADFIATRSALKFEITRIMLEARRERQNAGLEVKVFERRLRLLGLTDHDIDALQAVLTGGKEACQPGCKDTDCAKGHASDSSRHDLSVRLGLYSLRAPFDGVVTQKHIALGEKLGGDADAFTVADMSSVWVDLSVYQKDLPYVHKGQRVHIMTGEGIPDVEGVIEYVFPIVDEKTRTCTARILLPNPRAQFRPGLFVSADVHVGKIDIPVLVPKDAVRRIEERSVIFIPVAGGFLAKTVETGRESSMHIEVVSGLKGREDYVVAGAFELQAQVVTSGLGAHAGHGH